MGSQPIPKNERGPVESAKAELQHIRRLLDRATADLEHGRLNEVHEALLAARRTYENLAVQVAKWSGEHIADQQVFTLQLAEIEQTITRSERRLAAHVTAL